MLIRWSERSPRGDHREDLSALWSQIWGAGGGQRPPMPVDLVERDKDYVLTAELAGFRPEEIDVTVKENRLLLSAKPSEDGPPEHSGHTYLCQERRTVAVERSFSLGARVLDGEIQASFEHGLLCVVIPKRSDLEARQIPVLAG